MEFVDVVRGRRMIRTFRSDPVPIEALHGIVELGLRAPSAGFSQGWDFIVLAQPDAVQRFWDASADPNEPADSWLTGLQQAPALVLCCSDKQTYLRRYAAPDKPWQDQQESHWPVPYWDVDTGMAAMIMLLAAVDSGLGALFFGVPTEAIGTVRQAFDIPDDRSIVGVIAIGQPAATKPSGSTRSRSRRPTAEVVHNGRFGVPLEAASMETQPSGLQR